MTPAHQTILHALRDELLPPPPPPRPRGFAAMDPSRSLPIQRAGGEAIAHSRRYGRKHLRTIGAKGGRN